MSSLCISPETAPLPPSPPRYDLDATKEKTYLRLVSWRPLTIWRETAGLLDDGEDLGARAAVWREVRSIEETEAMIGQLSGVIMGYLTNFAKIIWC